jgi:uncharacterized protein
MRGVFCMKDDAESLLSLADEMMADAKLLLAEDRMRSSASRAYYAVYNAASAVLHSLGSSPKTHSGTLSEFSRAVVAPGLMDKGAAKTLRQLFELRQACDYNSYYRVDEVVAAELVCRAEEFIGDSRSLLEKQGVS